MDERTKKSPAVSGGAPAFGSLLRLGGGGGALLDRLEVAKGLPCYSTATATLTATGTLAYCQINIR